MSDDEKTTDVAVKDETVHRMDGLMPVTWQDKYDMGVMLIKSQMLPSSLDTPAKVFIALQMGHELGLSPMMACNNITAINGKASLSADLIVALCRKHPDFVAMEQSYNPEQGATVTMRRRKGEVVEMFTATFTPEDAKAAGLAGKQGPWTQYPQRMYLARAKAFCGRDAFPDILAGLISEEEAMGLDAPPQQAVEMTAELERVKGGETQTEEAEVKVVEEVDDPLAEERAVVLEAIQAFAEVEPDRAKAAEKALRSHTTRESIETLGAQVTSEHARALDKIETEADTREAKIAEPEEDIY